MSVERKEFLLFEIGTEMVGIFLDHVEEVTPCSPSTPIPRTAGFVRGLAAVRGRVMSVIDGGLRLGIPSHKDNNFLICKVRGNATAVAITKPVEAGAIWVRRLGNSEQEQYFAARPTWNRRAFLDVFQIFRETTEGLAATEQIFPEVRTDLFVSDQMASQLQAKAG